MCYVKYSMGGGVPDCLLKRTSWGSFCRESLVLDVAIHLHTNDATVGVDVDRA
jgi:hypothetical protein